MLRTIARGLADVLFPPVCVSCRGLVEDSPFRHLCRACAGRLEYCAGRPDEPLAAVRFHGPARALVVELKYRHGLHVLEDMAEIFRRAPGVIAVARHAVLVPVPLHPRKRRERGYNQSALLAAALAHAAAGARVAPLLRRIVDTPSQTALDRAERRANLKNAFALAPGAGLNPRHRYLIVDDVFTTGFTLDGCLRALRDEGGVNADAAAFAHG